MTETSPSKKQDSQAHAMDSVDRLKGLPKELRLEIAKHLDPESASNFIRTCKEVYENNDMRRVVEAKYTIKEVACGLAHTMLLTEDGKVYACGVNEDGQLGVGDETNKNRFTQITEGFPSLDWTNLEDFNRRLQGRS